MTETSPEQIIDYAPQLKEPKVKPEKSGGNSAALGTALVLTWAAMAGGFIYIQKQQKTAPAPVAVDISGLEAEIASLRQKLAEQSGAAADIGQLREQLSDVKAVAEAPREDRVSPRVDEVESRLVKLEEQAAQDAASLREGRMAPLMLAVLNLRDRIAKGLPHEADIAALKQLAAMDSVLMEQVAQLESQLARALPAATALLERLKGIGPEVIAASQDPNAGWLERLKQAFARLVTVRKLGTMKDGTTPENMLWRAEDALAHGDIATAATELRALPQAAQPAVAPWLTDAERVIAAEAAFTQLVERIGVLGKETPDTTASTPSMPAPLPPVLPNSAPEPFMAPPAMMMAPPGMMVPSGVPVPPDSPVASPAQGE